MTTCVIATVWQMRTVRPPNYKRLHLARTLLAFCTTNMAVRAGLSKGTHLLVLEDDDIDAAIIPRALRGVESIESITLARDGEEGLAMLRSGHLPLHRLVILLELRMPRMSGLAFLDALRADPNLRSLPVVALTTSSDLQYCREAYRLNVAGYFIKPVKFEDFKQTVRAVTNYWCASAFPPNQKSDPG
jgi:CheY-like chemotaxis protein